MPVLRYNGILKAGCPSTGSTHSTSSGQATVREERTFDRHRKSQIKKKHGGIKMKTRTVFILSITAILTLAAGSAFGSSYSGGSGTAGAPYQIATKADLLALAANTGDYGKCFILTADINMEGQVFTKAIIADLVPARLLQGHLTAKAITSLTLPLTAGATITSVYLATSTKAARFKTWH